MTNSENSRLISTHSNSHINYPTRTKNVVELSLLLLCHGSEGVPLYLFPFGGGSMDLGALKSIQLDRIIIESKVEIKP